MYVMYIRGNTARRGNLPPTFRNYNSNSDKALYTIRMRWPYGQICETAGTVWQQALALKRINLIFEWYVAATLVFEFSGW
jgi:hypothetical protein